MRNLKLFLTSLLVGLLVCGNAWGATATAEIKASTTLPSLGTPEYQFYIVNTVNNSYYWQGDTKWTTSTNDRGKFAFYKAPVDNAYYIYSVTENKWVTVPQSKTNSDEQDVVQMANDYDANSYWLVESGTRSETAGYGFKIRRYTVPSSGVPTFEFNKYANFYKGISENAGKAIGLYSTGPSTDNGSCWSLVPVEETDYNMMLSRKIVEAKAEYEKRSEYTSSTGLITATSQFVNDWGDKDEGTDAKLSYLIDGISDTNASHIWHSDWHNQGTTGINGKQYLGVKISAQTKVKLTIQRRNSSGDHPVRFSVYGTNAETITAKDKKDWKRLAVLDITLGAKASVQTSEIFDVKNYQKLRFYCDDTNCIDAGNGAHRGYFSLAEFQLNPQSLTNDCWNALNPEKANALLSAISTAEAVTTATQTNIDDLQTAIEAYKNISTYQITYNYVYSGSIFTTLQGEHFKTETIAKAMDYKAAPTYFGLNVTKEVSTDGGTTYTTLADDATPSANCIVRFSYADVDNFPFVPTTIVNNDFASGTKYYKMKLNGKYGKYNSTDNCVDNVSEVDENNATLFQFAFVGDPVNGYTIYNKERGTSKKFYENSPGNGGAAITFIDSPNGYWTMGASTVSGGGYWLKETSGTDSYLNDRGSKFSFWITTAAEAGSGSRIFFEIYDIAAYAADLQATIDAVSEYPTTTTGQTGYYTKSTLDGFIETAQTALEDENRTCATLAAAKKTLLANAETAVVYPVLEGYYQWISALEFTAGEMDIYVDGTNLKWHGRDNTDMTSYWEVMKIEDGKYTFKNEASDVYPTAITNETQSQVIVSETENAMILTHLVGTNAWALSPDGSSIDKKYFHCYGHGNGSGTSGQIIGYYTGGASNWILEQVDDPELSVEKAKLQTRVEELEAISTNNLWGTNPGYYPADKQSTVEAAVVTAKETLNGGSKIASAYTTALTTLNSTIGADFGVIMPTPGAYYRLHQVGQNRYAYAKAGYLNSVKPLKTTDTDAYKKGTSAIIKFEDGGSGYYNLKTFNGKYVQAASKSAHVKLETSSVLYNVYSPDSTSFLLSTDKERYTNLHTNNANVGDADIVGWENGPNSRWYIEPVTDFTPYNVAYSGLGDGITVTSVTYTEPVTEEALVISTDGFIALQNGVANPTATNFAAVCSNEYWKVGSVSVEDGTITLNFIYDEVSIPEGLYTIQSFSRYEGTTYYNQLTNNNGTLTPIEYEYMKCPLSAVFYVNGKTITSQGTDVSNQFEVISNTKVRFNSTEYGVAPINNSIPLTLNSNSQKKRFFGTVCAPFELTLPEAVDAYNTMINSTKRTITLTKRDEKTIPAGTPVVIYSNQGTAQELQKLSISVTLGEASTYTTEAPDGGNYNFIDGTYLQKAYSETQDENNCGYVLGLSSDKIGFYIMADNATIGANKAYITTFKPSDDPTAKGFTITFDDAPTAIYELVDGELVDKNAPIYNLGGQKLNKLQKGINIVNGKKILF